MTSTMKKSVIASVLFFLFMLWAVSTYLKAEEAAQFSCLASTRKALNQSSSLFVPHQEVFPDYRRLKEKGYNSALLLLEQTQYPLECPPTMSKSGLLLLDRWNRRVEIAVRRNEHDEYEFMVWSKGRDGISKTSDDILTPSQSPPDL